MGVPLSGESEVIPQNARAPASVHAHSFTRSIGSQRVHTVLGSCPVAVSAGCRTPPRFPCGFEAVLGVGLVRRENLHTVALPTPDVRSAPSGSKYCFAIVFGIKQAHFLLASKC